MANGNTLATQAPPPALPNVGDMMMFICTGGWIWVGCLVAIEQRQDDTVSRWWISDRAAIRSWGTTRGLGEIVQGPTTKTEIECLTGLANGGCTDINDDQVMSHIVIAKTPWMKLVAKNSIT